MLSDHFRRGHARRATGILNISVPFDEGSGLADDEQRTLEWRWLRDENRRLNQRIDQLLRLVARCQPSRSDDDRDGARPRAAGTAENSAARAARRIFAQDTFAQDTFAQDTFAQDTFAQDKGEERGAPIADGEFRDIPSFLRRHRL